ncbi:hypothetical protein GGR21_001485 [Dysgonomonas hofstadii]|uniref:Uncharacterized protein n=1 Tax=Dysgonomonas hofstadii TaxID=637886 RepID=A0A840CSS4_9BACT|nr:hypothetical protein [Dysgonomonas hofstadii]MBB4035592.1 hypothetical protein [Dysgonomonas hofstadii]
MKVAIFVKDEKISSISPDAFYVLVFTLNEDIIIGLEIENFYNNNIGYISVWLLNRKVNVVFMESAEDGIRYYFSQMNIEVRSFDDLKKNHIFRAFLM